MRSLKFRAWDKKEKRYYYDAERTYDHQCRGYGCFEDNFGEVLDQPNRFIVEQYTGLKDTNGKKIYEGDLMRLSSTKAPALKGRNLVVKFDEFDIGEYNCQKMVGWMVEVVDNDWEWASSLSDVVSFCEVIGNIHENLELLDKNNRV